MLILKVKNLHLIKCMYKKTLWDMLKLLIIHVILLDKNIKQKVLYKRLKKNGKILILLFNHIKRHLNLKEHKLFFQFYNNTWEYYQIKKQVYFTKTSKIRYKYGKITYNEFHKHYKC